MPCPALQRMRIWRKYFIKLNQECHQRRGIHQHVYKDVSCGMLTVEHFVSSARSSLRNHVPIPIQQPICQFSVIPSHTTVSTAISPKDWCYSISATESSSYTQLTLMQSMQQTKKCNMYHMTERTYVPRRPCSLLASHFPTTRLRSRSCAREPSRRNIDVSLSIIL